MTQQEIAKMTRYEILNALLAQGFEINAYEAAEVSKTIQHAARAGALRWTPEHITSTLHNAPLDIRRTK